MKQYLLTLFLALAASVAPLFAQSGTCGDNLTWTLDTESGTLTISGTGAMTNNDPSYSNAPWYSSRSSIKTVIIEDGVTSIGDLAFYYCSRLTSITIPNSVTTIGDGSFNGCRSLTSITIPNSVIIIGDYYAFSDCRSLTSITVDSENPNYCDIDGVLFNKNKTTLIQYPAGKSATSYTIPNSVTSIGSEAFSYCSGLTSVIIPNSVTSIERETFYGCSSLTSVTIPNSVTSIGDYAFDGCSSLTSVTIPNSVTSIGGGAFSSCSSLTSVTIPNSVTSIERETFYGCSSLTSITIPNSVTSIGDGAFEDCSSLTSITIPNSVTSIGEYAFYDCSSLTSIVVENGNTKYDSRNNCNAIIETTTNTLIAGCQNTIIPNTVTSIGYSAFQSCRSLTSITIPSSVTSIGGAAFSNCCSLTSVTCEAINPPSLETDVFYNVDKSIPLYVPTESINAYKAAYQWKEFTNILPITVVGTFSVSATQKVTFSPGNLQFNAASGTHQCADGTTKQGTWRFAEHQWDMVGMGYGQTNTDWCYIGGTVANSDNRQIGSNYNGWIDLFGWGTSGWNSGANAYQPYSTSQTNSDYYPGGSYENSLTGNYANADWGVYNQIGDDAPGSWRTLTNDEWNYLFSGRANASSKYGVGMVNGINGMIVLPDEFTLPSGLTFNAGMASSSGYQYYQTKNNYSAAEWERMEACGALFLPAAGYRYGSYVYYVGDGGYYWSSTPYDASYAYYRGFGSDGTSWYYGSRHDGFSVRLVRAAKSEQEPVYSLSVSVEGEGTVTGAGEYKNGTTATLTATPAEGYTFTQWSDGNTDNPRTITMTQNMNLSAVFAKNTFLVSFLNYDGTELQSSEVEAGTMPQYNGITPTKPADAQYTYTFAGWDKEVVAVTGDATYTAVFVSVVQCGTIETTDGITVWEDLLPYTWEGISFTTAGTETKTLQASDGCDSIVTFTLRVLYRNITLQENESADYYTQFAQDYNGQTVTTATLNRQFTSGKWSTLCLPFDVNKAMMMSLGLYNRVFALRYAQQLDDETIQMYFAPAQSLEAGKGYIVNANTKLAQKTSFVFPNVTINTDSDNGDITALTGYNDGTNRGNLFLVGTLRTGILQGSTTGNTYLGLKDNQLYYPNSTSGTPMRAYRAVFRSDIPVNASRLRIIADGETVTELQVMNGEEDLQETPPARKYIDNGILYIERNGITYTAQGQRLD